MSENNTEENLVTTPKHRRANTGYSRRNSNENLQDKNVTYKTKGMRTRLVFIPRVNKNQNKVVDET